MSPKRRFGFNFADRIEARAARRIGSPTRFAHLSCHKDWRGCDFALCLVAITTVASAAFLWIGLTPVTAVLAAVALGCPLAALYAWWLARRALRTLDAERHAGSRSTR